MRYEQNRADRTLIAQPRLIAQPGSTMMMMSDDVMSDDGHDDVMSMMMSDGEARPPLK